MKAIGQKDAPLAAREEYRKLLDLFPNVAEQNGHLATLFRRHALSRFESQPAIEEAVNYQMTALRSSLAGEQPSPIESLLVDAMLACYHDYWMFAIIVEQKTGSSFTLHEMEKWERILASKEARYLRVVETLARVRRLLNLPAPQVNINMPGGQQVNIAGDLKAQG